MSDRKLRVAHIVPGMTIGGVEIAIQRSFERLNERFDYRVFWVKRPGSLPVKISHVVRLLATAIWGGWRPDVVVTSLWYAHPFGWILRLLGAEWIGFFHNAGFSNSVDHRVQRWAWRRADRLFVDSKATLDAMCQFGQRRAEAVPYIFEQEFVARGALREFELIWVGRSVPAKRIDLFLDLVEASRAWRQSRRCAVVVAGEVPEAVQVAAADPSKGLTLFNNLANTEVRALLERAKYYVLTSNYEGMSMTTIEAVQSGCVPVVRPVGEIGSYLDRQGAFFIESGTRQAIMDVSTTLARVHDDAALGEAMLASARSGVRHLGTYVDAFSSGIELAVGRAAE